MLVCICFLSFIYLCFSPISETFWEALSGGINTGKSIGSRETHSLADEAVIHGAAVLLSPSSKSVLWTKLKEEADEIGTSFLKL